MELISNPIFILEEESNTIYITVKEMGMTPIQFSKYIEELPRISITRFSDLKNELDKPTGKRLYIGEYKPLCQVTIAKDKMTAKIKLHVTANELETRYDSIRQAVFDELMKQDVTEGILTAVINGELVALRDIVVAQGIPPVHGEDSIVRYYKRSERKPTIREDGKADYFDMNFIDEVKQGEWLGERIPETAGSPGRTVTGEEIPAMPGKKKRLLYDPKSVAVHDEHNKQVLRARFDGVVDVINGKIAVGNHLVIAGDVGIETGNIDFFGSVTIHGTVQPGFSVRATHDISILSELGMSSAHSVVSERGDIFIKGGVFGQSSTVIKAAKNVFLKHANECIIEAGDNIHIGYYTIGSQLKAKNVYTDETKGKIIGGQIEARGKVHSAFIGNKLERKTIIHVEGFDRAAVKAELDGLLLKYKDAISRIDMIKRQLEIFDSFLEQLNEQQYAQYESLKQRYDSVLEDVTGFETARQDLMDLLETRGEGEISILHSAFPETFIEIKNMRKKLQQTTRGTFYALGTDLHYE